MTHLKRITTLALLIFATAVCDTTPPQPSPRLKGPVAMVPAGARVQNTPDPLGGNDTVEFQQRFPFIYIVGGERDVVYVMDVTQRVEGTFVRAPNKFFPLEIPVDQVPVDGAATHDGAYVVVVSAGAAWNNSRAAINLIDTSTHRRVTLEDQVTPLRQEGALGSGPSVIVQAPKTVTAPERFYIALPGEKAVAVVDVSYNPLAVKVVDKIVNTGSIARMVLDGTGQVLYGADSSSPFVHRVNVVSKEVRDIDVGGPSLDVALIPNGERDELYVARPDILSIARYDPDTGAHIASNPIFAPRLPDDVPFEDIYVASVPARIRLEERRLAWRCVTCLGIEQSDQNKTLSAYVLVATDDGEVLYVHPTEAQLLNHRHCDKPQVVATATVDNAFTGATPPPFVPCGTPALNRVQCAGVPVPDADGKVTYLDSGVAVFPGYTPSSTFNLTYEAVAPGLDRKNGGGRLLGNGSILEDASLDSSLLPIPLAIGDIVTIESRVNSNEGACGALNVNSPEITITALLPNAETGHVGMQLSHAVPPTCFTTDVGYTVRLGGSFLLSGSQLSGARAPLARLKPGETYGLGAEVVRFTILTDPPAPYVRDQFFEFNASAPYDRVQQGRALNSAGTDLVTLGRLPTSMIVNDFGPPEAQTVPSALVAFGGNDVLLRLMSNDTLNACQSLPPENVLR